MLITHVPLFTDRTPNGGWSLHPDIKFSIRKLVTLLCIVIWKFLIRNRLFDKNGNKLLNNLFVVEFAPLFYWYQYSHQRTIFRIIIMIKAILVFNNYGKPRLSKFYQYFVSTPRPTNCPFNEELWIFTMKHIRSLIDSSIVEWRHATANHQRNFSVGFQTRW